MDKHCANSWFFCGFLGFFLMKIEIKIVPHEKLWVFKFIDYMSIWGLYGKD